MLNKDLKELNRLIINAVTDLENSYGIRVEEITINRDYTQDIQRKQAPQLRNVEPNYKLSIVNNER